MQAGATVGFLAKLASAFEVRLARLVEQHPVLWKASWELVKRIPILLPHDKSYNAFRHFVRAMPDGLFLDIGANDGISALGFRRFSRQYRILSLEPNPMLEPALRELKRCDPLFDYRMVGAGSNTEPMPLDLFMPVYHGIALHTYTSASRERSASALKDICGDRVARAARIDKMTVLIVNVDSLQVHPSIVKIDAEGYDYEVLAGAARTVEQSRPFVVVEIAWSKSDSIQKFFANRNYELLSYSVGRDRFGPLSQASNQGERNSFAIPREWLSAMPLSGKISQQALSEINGRS
jgi:FkbM family methyltransferase